LTIRKAKYELLGFILLWLGISAISWYLIALKYWALDFHTRDYAFYTEFIIKWSKPASEQFYTINPGGYNFLGVNAVDGCDGFYQWIHLEPIRFFQAFIYQVFQSIHAVFIFNALVVCSPVLAMGLWLKKSTAGYWEKIIWVLFFILFPATLLAAGYDNRPSMFLGVGYFWILYFLLATHHKWGQYISFLLLFTIREEALILNGAVCIYLFFKWRDKQFSGNWLGIYLGSYIIYATGLGVYFNYWHYHLLANAAQSYSPIVLISVAILILSLAGYALWRKKYFLWLLMPCLLVVFQLSTMYQKGNFPDVGFSAFNDPRNLLWGLLVMGFLIYWRTQKQAWPLWAAFIGLPFFLCFTWMGTHNLRSKYSGWNRQYKNTYMVNNISKLSQNKGRNKVANSLIPLSSLLITDYSTHQAFVGRPNVVCFERLPCTFEKSDQRFYPKNTYAVKELMREGTWIILSKKNLKEMELLLADTAYFIAQENDDFVALTITSHHL
jgi:hypothetical protein